VKSELSRTHYHRKMSCGKIHSAAGKVSGSPGMGFYISFPTCGTNLRTETCLYTKSAKKRRGVGGQEWRGREATKEGCTAAAPIVRPQMEYL